MNIRRSLILWTLVAAALCMYTPLAEAERAADEPRLPETGDLMDMSIEELGKIKIHTVSGASRYEQKVTEAPSSITIITDDDIRKYGYRTLADILRSVRGFSVAYDRNYSYTGVRGFSRPGDYNTRVLLLVDGHRINDNIYDQAPIGTEFPLDVDLIKRIEIIRGPGSSLYGSNALFGVINVVTRDGSDMAGVETAAAAGSYDTYSGRVTYGLHRQGGATVLASGTVYDSGGQRRLYYPEFDSPFTNNGIADHNDGDGLRSAFSKLSFGDFTLAGAYGRRKKEVPTASFNTIFNDPRNRTIDEHGYLDLTWRRSLSGTSSVMARMYYDAFNFSGDFPVNYPPATLNRDISKGRWWGGEAQSTTQPFERHKLTAGVEYRDNLHQDQRNFDVDPSFPHLDSMPHSRFWALYVQDEYRPTRTVLVNVGARHDHYSTFGNMTSPRLALIYSPGNETAFKILYGTAFRAPNVYELYYNDGGSSSKANPGLNPEKVRTSELVYEQYFGRYYRTSLSGFEYWIYNLITAHTDPADGLLQYNNADTSKARGAELEVEGNWPKGLKGRASHLVQRTTDSKTGEVMSNIPEHLSKLNLVVPLLNDRLFAGPEVRYTSSRKTVGGGRTAAFVVTNLTLFGQNRAKRLDASCSIYNLFNTRYYDPGAGPPQHSQDAIEQDGRSFRIKLVYRF